MLDIDLEETLVQMCGGKFALTSLMQKRLVELNRGAPPLVALEGENRHDHRRIVTEEILQGKIVLEITDEIGQAIAEPVAAEPVAVESSTSALTPPPSEGEDGEGSDVEIYGSDIKKIKEQRIKELSQLLNPKK